MGKLAKKIQIRHSSYRPNLFVALVAATAVTGLWFFFTWRYGFDLADEGFYWYGAQRILHGEIPLRDFTSYDIGRYFWAAGFMRLIGSDGPYVARLGAAVFQLIGIWIGIYICLLALRWESVSRWMWAFCVGIILTVWMNPYYKAFDHSTCIIIVAMLVLMQKSNKPAAWLLAGVILGLAAIIGRNHGVYGAISAMLLVGVQWYRSPSRSEVCRSCTYFCLGVLIGFSPTVFIMLVAPGFADMFFKSILALFKNGTTNIGLPVPWPWVQNLDGLGFVYSTLAILTGCGFILVLIFPFLGLVALQYPGFALRGDSRKVLVSATAASIPYAHYAFSRADSVHLALAVFPTLIGLLTIAGTMQGRRSMFMALLLLGISVGYASNKNAFFSHYLLNKELVPKNISGHTLYIFPRVKHHIEQLAGSLTSCNGASRNFLALPDMPSLYAMFHAKMPIREIYSLVPRDGAFEKSEIKRLKETRPKVVLVSGYALDGNSNFKYSHTHPLTYSWIISNYKLTSVDKYRDDVLQVYTSRNCRPHRIKIDLEAE